MVGAIVALSAILGYALLLNRVAKWPLESCFLFVTTSTVCLLFFSGLVGALSPISQVLLVAGVLLFVMGIFSQWKGGGFREQISPGVMFFLGSTVVVWLLTHSAYYSNFVWVDDFAHWGRVSKIIASNNRLINTSDAVLFKTYPPGTALFNYQFFRVEGYSESLAMFAQGVFVLAAVSHLFAHVPWTAGRYVIGGVSGFIVGLLYTFGVGFHTLCADLILGVIFGVGLFGYLTDRRCGVMAAIIRLVPVVMVLPLIKQIGIFFSLVIVATVLCDVLVEEMDWTKKRKCLAMTSVLALTCMLSQVAWDQHVRRMGFGPNFATSLKVGEVAQALFSDSATDTQKATVSHFTHHLVKPFLNGFKKINLQQYLLLVSASFLVFMGRTREGDQSVSWKRFAPIAVLFVGFLAYLVILLVLYLFYFSPYEGTRLASFDRYANTYLLGLVLVLFGISLSRYLSSARSKAATIVFVILCVLVVVPNVGAVVRDVTHVVEAEMGKQKPGVIEHASEFWKVVDNYTLPTSRIYFVWQHSAGMELQVLSYRGIPRTFNSSCWSLGEPYDSGDVWTCRISTTDLEKTLSKYDFLFIGRADEKLEAILSPLARAGGLSNGSLFAILNDNDPLAVRRIH